MWGSDITLSRNDFVSVSVTMSNTSILLMGVCGLVLAS